MWSAGQFIEIWQPYIEPCQCCEMSPLGFRLFSPPPAALQKLQKSSEFKELQALSSVGSAAWTRPGSCGSVSMGVVVQDTCRVPGSLGKLIRTSLDVAYSKLFKLELRCRAALYEAGWSTHLRRQKHKRWCPTHSIASAAARNTREGGILVCGIAACLSCPWEGGHGTAYAHFTSGGK